MYNAKSMTLKEEREYQRFHAMFGAVAKVLRTKRVCDLKHTKAFWVNYDKLKQKNPALAEKFMACLKDDYSVDEDVNIRNPSVENNIKDGKVLSVKWVRVRYIAFILYGNKCSCCGAGPSTTTLTVDHIKPKSLYPKLATDIRNLQILCEECNVAKSNCYEHDFRTEQQKIDAITAYYFPAVVLKNTDRHVES